MVMPFEIQRKVVEAIKFQIIGYGSLGAFE
jgi:hypothetical protein